MVLAFLGQLAPISAALIHVGSELASILNSAMSIFQILILQERLRPREL